MSAEPTAARFRTAPELTSRLKRLLAAAPDWGCRALEHARQRRALEALNDDQLRDIGLSRGEALREAAKPFWRP
jgi:uncharacterized protein YjiS (DUF1127 family)